MYKRKLIVFAQ